MVARVDHPNLSRFRFPNVGDSERSGRKPYARRDPKPQRMIHVGRGGVIQNVSDRRDCDEVRNEGAD